MPRTRPSSASSCKTSGEQIHWRCWIVFFLKCFRSGKLESVSEALFSARCILKRVFYRFATYSAERLAYLHRAYGSHFGLCEFIS